MEHGQLNNKSGAVLINFWQKYDDQAHRVVNVQGSQAASKYEHVDAHVEELHSTIQSLTQSKVSLVSVAERLFLNSSSFRCLIAKISAMHPDCTWFRLARNRPVRIYLACTVAITREFLCRSCAMCVYGFEQPYTLMCAVDMYRLICPFQPKSCFITPISLTTCQ